MAELLPKMTTTNKTKAEKILKDLFSIIFSPSNIKAVEILNYDEVDGSLSVKVVFNSFIVRDHALKLIKSLILISGFSLRYNKILKTKKIYFNFVSDDEE